MRRVALISIALSLAVVTATAQKAEHVYQHFVDKVVAGQERITRWEGKIDFSAFDLEEYLAIFDKLTLHAPGMSPVYDHTGENGFARVYLLADSVNFDSFVKEWEGKRDAERGLFDGMDEYTENNRPSLKFRAEDSPEGYFQLIVLRELGERRFALSWHANYGKTFFACSREAIGVILEELEKSWGWDLNDEQRATIRRIDPAPKVSIEGDRCIIRVVAVDPFGGIYAQTFAVSRGFPHIVEKTGNETLFYYWPMLMF